LKSLVWREACIGFLVEELGAALQESCAQEDACTEENSRVEGNSCAIE
jgi:hypothetical protein